MYPGKSLAHRSAMVGIKPKTASFRKFVDVSRERFTGHSASLNGDLRV
jgi:hypothetical protein